MKKKQTAILAGILFLAGLGVFLYPTLADRVNRMKQGRLIESHEAALGEMTAQDLEAQWERAERYNAEILENNICSDVFEETGEAPENAEYWQVLNLEGDMIMGYLSIPKIDMRMPVYHGTAEGVLQIGAGHLSGTSLPIGGEGTHSVLAAHRGLPSAKLFTDIDRLEEGDRFYIRVLDETLAYEVDRISPMVDKDDLEALSKALAIVPGEDHVTLFTCTPCGVNSHRLLVRGRRTADLEPEEMGEETGYAAQYDVVIWIVGLAVAAALVLILCRWRQEGKQ